MVRVDLDKLNVGKYSYEELKVFIAKLLEENKDLREKNKSIKATKASDEIWATNRQLREENNTLRSMVNSFISKYQKIMAQNPKNIIVKED